MTENQKFDAQTLSLIEQAIYFYETGKFIEAKRICKQLLNKNKKIAEAHNILGLIYYNKKSFNKARYNYKQAIELAPHNALFVYNLAFVYLAEHDFQQAIMSLRQAISNEVNYIQAYLTLGSVYLSCNMLVEAKQIMLKLLQIDPQSEKAEELLGTTHEILGESIEAKVCYQNVLSKNPRNITALINLSKIYAQSGFLQEGVDCLLKAKEVEPNNANIYNNLGNLLLLFNRPKDAKTAFAEALKLEPNRLVFLVNYILTINTLGESFLAKKMFTELLTDVTKYSAAAHETPTYFINKAKIGLTIACCYICDWDKLDNYKPKIIDLILESIAKGDHSLIVPFHTIMLALPWDIVRKATAYYVQQQLKKKSFVLASYQVNNEANVNAITMQTERKIRLAYLSPDFGDHAVGLLLRSLFKYHDRTKFEVYGLSLREYNDHYAILIKDSVDHFVDLSYMSDQAIITAIQQLNLDLLVDLAGHTIGSKPAVVMAKLARKQINWFGYPYTMENPAVEYFLSHKMLTPPALHKHFSEQIIYLPDAWYACEAFETLDKLSVISREQYGLPADSFVFCCFNKAYRLSKNLFACWAKILHQVPNSILWLNSFGDELNNYLLQYLQLLGIGSERIFFAINEKMTIHWRHRLADVWLDTFNLTTGTGNILCIWAELPVLTLAGATSQSRVGATILASAGLEELIVNNEEEYVNLAVKLALDKGYYLHIKDRIRAAKSSTLFNPEKFIPELEQAYMKILG